MQPVHLGTGVAAERLWTSYVAMTILETLGFEVEAFNGRVTPRESFFCWDAAHEASGADWMIPYLIQLLEDPYDSVRIVAYLALKKRPQFADWSYDVIGSPVERGKGAQRAWTVFYEAWSQGVPAAPASVLYDASGRLRSVEFRRLAAQRDDRRMSLTE